MQTKLQTYALPCPVILQEKTDALESASYENHFEADEPPDRILVVDENGVHIGMVSAKSTDLVETDIICLSARLNRARQIECLVDADLDQLSYGVILTDTDNGFGDNQVAWISPEAVSHWLAQTAREALTETSKFQDKIQDKDRQTVMFLANMSHELRTPLNAILGYADLIRSKTFGPVQPTQYGSYIESIHRSGQHLLNSITSLLSLAKIDAGALELHEEDVCVRQLISQTVDMIKTEADGLHVDVIAKVPEVFPSLYCDPQLLRQALLNLISNAVKFSPSGSTVRVTASRVDRGSIRISVGDRGPGIPKSELEHIVRPFKQASHGPGRTGVGTGLGLSLAKAFVEMHEGQLRISSVEGRGTRAMLTLPPGRVRDTADGFQGGFAFVRNEAIA